MTNENKEQLLPATVKTTASAELARQVEDELKLADPSLDKAKAMLGLEDDCE